jgi:hypothetical protein
MNFNSVGASNSRNYAQAAKSAVDAQDKAFAIARKTGPDYAMLSKTAMNNASAEKVTAMKAEEAVTKAGITAVGNVKQTELRAQTGLKLSKMKAKQRMAGGVAALGRIAGAGYLAFKDNTKGREYPTADRTGIYENYKAKRDGLIEGRESQRGTFKPTEFNPQDSSVSTGTGSSNSGSTGGTAGKGTSAKPGDMAMSYMEKLTSQGFSDTQAAATVGHLMVESDNFKALEEYSPNAYGTKGYGHLQWTNAGGSNRRTNFEQYVKNNNLNPASFEANSGFLLSEMQGNHGQHWTGGGSLDGFKGTQNLQQASSYLQNNYIRPGVPHTDRRISNAQNVLTQWQNR